MKFPQKSKPSKAFDLVQQCLVRVYNIFVI